MESQRGGEEEIEIEVDWERSKRAWRRQEKLWRCLKEVRKVKQEREVISEKARNIVKKGKANGKGIGQKRMRKRKPCEEGERRSGKGRKWCQKSDRQERILEGVGGRKGN